MHMATIGVSFEKNIGRLLNELSPRARSVIKRRYGLASASPMTLEAIGKKEGITRERVRQIEYDALGKLKKSEVLSALSRERGFVVDTIQRYGGVVAEDALLGAPEFGSVHDKKNLVLFLDLCDALRRRSESDAFYARWHAADAPVSNVEGAMLELSRELALTKATLKEEDMLKAIESKLKRAGIEDIRPVVLTSYIGISKELQKNTWGEYGHIASPFVRPRGMRDGAYVVLARAKEPLHFREIAKRIEEFSPRNVHVQTVHNELIKDDRFVLVGRGLYALQEWGYEPGFIKDVLVRLIKERGALSKEEIVSEILKLRQVKPGTILINLQNKKLFRPLDNGTYTLVS